MGLLLPVPQVASPMATISSHSDPWPHYFMSGACGRPRACCWLACWLGQLPHRTRTAPLMLQQQCAGFSQASGPHAGAVASGYSYTKVRACGAATRPAPLCSYQPSAPPAPSLAASASHGLPSSKPPPPAPPPRQGQQPARRGHRGGPGHRVPLRRVGASSAGGRGTAAIYALPTHQCSQQQRQRQRQQRRQRRQRQQRRQRRQRQRRRLRRLRLRPSLVIE
jgi:hypothetical protein